MNERQKQLKEEYKKMKPKMGILIVRNIKDGKCFIDTAVNLKAMMNSTRFRLERRCHPNKELQKAWLEQGESSFTIEVLDELEYDKDETKTDYTEDLQTLKNIWAEKLAKENGLEYYKKSKKKFKKPVDIKGTV